MNIDRPSEYDTYANNSQYGSTSSEVLLTRINCSGSEADIMVFSPFEF